MSRADLEPVATRYNSLLREFLQSTNERFQSSRDYVYDLSDKEDLDNLRSQGYDITVGLMQPPLAEAYGIVSAWADKHLKAGTIGYKRRIGKPIKGHAILSEMVQAETVQSGLCVAGGNTSLSDFEIHLFGREVLVPHLFDGFTIVADGSKMIDQKRVDLASARMIYMPSGRGKVYILGNKVAHYAPHGIALMGVALPNMTNDETPTNLERHCNSVYGRMMTHRNKVFASSNPEAPTGVMVLGSTPAKKVLLELQRHIDISIAPRLKEALK